MCFNYTKKLSWVRGKEAIPPKAKGEVQGGGACKRSYRKLTGMLGGEEATILRYHGHKGQPFSMKSRPNVVCLFTILPKIQSSWKGFYVRKFVFNYYNYRQQMAQVVRTNEIVR